MSAPDFLAQVTARRLTQVGGAVGEVTEIALSGFCRETLDFERALARSEGVAVIAEVKKASPSAGDIAPAVDVGAQAAAYQSGGAAAVSVLAEPTDFKGSFEDVSAARETISIPVLCKDFVVHHNQILFARASGADAILLMASVLGERLPAFVAASRDCGLEPLVEVHDAEEYALARIARARVLGVNARDLRDLSVDREGSLALIRRAAQDGLLVVAESGIRSRADVEEAAAAGARAVLVGEHVMRAEDPAQAVEAMTGVAILVRAAT